MNLSKMNKYVAALAVAGVSVAAQSASAAVVWSGPVNINIPSTTAGIYLNVVSGASGGSTTAGWDFNPWNTTNLSTFGTATQGGVPGGTVYVGTAAAVYSNLAFNAPIGPASTFTNVGVSNPAAGALNLNSSNNIIGFRFVNEANGNQQHFGWARISLGATAGGQPRSIVEYAYESVAGTAIGAGVVPTPGAAGLLAVAGLAGIRRRR